MRNFGILTAAVLVLAGIATASAHEATNKGVTVAHPWTRATPGGATVGAAFLEIKTDKGTTDKLISASSPAAGRVEIHTHIMDGDVMKMRRVEAIDLKDGESHILKPMGDHIMLFDLKQPLKEGELVKLELTFEKADTIALDATVEPAGALGPHGMDHQPGNEGHDHGDAKSGHDHHDHK